MANPTTNFGWVMPTSTSLVTNLPADFNTFGQGVDTSMAQLKGGTTGQILSKTSATDMAFTWITPNPGDITGVTAGTGISGGGTSGDVTVTNSMATAMTTKGDLVPATGSGTFSRLAIGTNGQVLTADSTAATGMKWNTSLASPLTTKGDIWTYSTTDARLAVGTNGQTLVADSSTATGLKWAAASSGALTLIKRATVTAVSDTGTTFDSTFSSNYVDYLVILENFRCGTGTPTMGLRFMTSGTAKTSGYYGSMIFGTYTATQYLASNAATQFNVFGLNSGSDNSATLTFQNITLASGTGAWTLNAQDGATDRYGAGGGLCAANSFTGFQLLPTSSTITGTVSVYGYAKA